MKVLYITYTDFSSAASGSALRPQKMYEAFLRSGHEVKLLSGSQEIRQRSARKAAVAEIAGWLRENTPDLCYIESPVYPILWGFDRRLIRRLHRMGVPIGYYYRDFHNQFPDYFSGRRDLPGRLKDMALRFLQKRTDSLLRSADVVYVPTEESVELLPYRCIRVLPPAGEDHLAENTPTGRSCLYVGGIVNQYSGELLLRAFQKLNAGEERYPLTLICRAWEWHQIPEELKSGDWLTVLHLSGADIVPYLQHAALGLLIGSDSHPYNRIAVSVKLYEYVGYGLPVVYLRNAPMDRIVGSSGIGEGAASTPEALAEAVRRVLNTEEFYRKNVKAFLHADNTWNNRVSKVISDLKGEKA